MPELVLAILLVMGVAPNSDYVCVSDIFPDTVIVKCVNPVEGTWIAGSVIDGHPDVFIAEGITI